MVVAVLAVATFADVAIAPPAHACSCVSFTDEQAFARADVVFVGRVPDHTVPSVSMSSTDPAMWTFVVDQVYKGEAASRQGVVSARASASCGMDVPRGVGVVVFARREPQATEPHVDGATLYAGLCGGTRAATERAIPAAFGRPRAPSGGESGVVDVGITGRDIRLVSVAAGSVAVLGGAALVFLLRRRRARARVT